VLDFLFGHRSSFRKIDINRPEFIQIFSDLIRRTKFSMSAKRTD
jgi:hypothetical protein